MLRPADPQMTLVAVARENGAVATMQAGRLVTMVETGEEVFWEPSGMCSGAMIDLIVQ